jgi:hypothetical protein
MNAEKLQAFQALYQEMLSTWLNETSAKWVIERHQNAPEEARLHFAEIVEAKKRGEDVTFSGCCPMTTVKVPANSVHGGLGRQHSLRM